MKPGRNDPCVYGSGKKYKKCYQQKLEASPAVRPVRQDAGVAVRKQISTSISQAETAQLVALFNAGRYGELESRSRLMLERYPDSGFVWNILGLTLRRQRKDGLQALQTAANLLPDNAEVHFNLGNTYIELGNLVEAERSFRRAIKAEPNFDEGHFTLARLFYSQGQFMLALNSTIQSLRIKETAENKSFFVTCVKQMQFGDGAAFVRENLLRALTEPWGRPSELSETSAVLIKLDPIIEGCVIQAIRAWPQRLSATDLLRHVDLSAVAGNRLLRTLIGATVVCDFELERLLTTCREALLDSASA